MSTLAIKFEPLALAVSFTEDMLNVVLADGRELSASLAWFQRLRKDTPKRKGRNGVSLVGVL